MSSSDPTQPGQPSPTPIPPDDDLAHWDQAATTFLLQLLERMQSNAKTWTEGVVALLGLFGAAALLSGFETITQIGPAWRLAVISLAAIIGMSGIFSVWQLTSAQQMPNIDEASWSGSAYRAWTLKAAKRAKKQVTRGRRAGMVSATSLFALGITILCAGAFNPSLAQ